MIIWQKQKKRSKLRTEIGKRLYTAKRYWKWYRLRHILARERVIKPNEYPVIVFTHKTPLLRQLKDVEMELQYNKITNLRVACEQLNGLVLAPGQLFSYWFLIGRPTRKKGYLKGMILEHGRYKRGVGGGLCQLSNLLYWMTLHTPLHVVERWRHSYDVFPDANRTQPFGSGATCFYNYVDLQIKNETQWEWCLEVEVGATHLIGRWRTRNLVPYHYEIFEQDHQFIPSPFGGYLRYNKICRKVYYQQQYIGEELVTENQAVMMYEPLLSGCSD